MPLYAFVVTKPWKTMKVKIRMHCFPSQVLFKALYELSKRLIVVLAAKQMINFKIILLLCVSIKALCPKCVTFPCCC